MTRSNYNLIDTVSISLFREKYKTPQRCGVLAFYKINKTKKALSANCCNLRLCTI